MALPWSCAALPMPLVSVLITPPPSTSAGPSAGDHTPTVTGSGNAPARPRRRLPAAAQAASLAAAQAAAQAAALAAGPGGGPAAALAASQAAALAAAPGGRPGGGQFLICCLAVCMKTRNIESINTALVFHQVTNGLRAIHREVAPHRRLFGLCAAAPQRIIKAIAVGDGDEPEAHHRLESCRDGEKLFQPSAHGDFSRIRLGWCKSFCCPFCWAFSINLICARPHAPRSFLASDARFLVYRWAQAESSWHCRIAYHALIHR